MRAFEWSTRLSARQRDRKVEDVAAVAIVVEFSSSKLSFDLSSSRRVVCSSRIEMHCFQIVALFVISCCLRLSLTCLLRLQSSDVLQAAGSAIVELAKPMIWAAPDFAALRQTQSDHRLTHPATEFEKAGA